jgi:hypothetical protein
MRLLCAFCCHLFPVLRRTFQCMCTPLHMLMYQLNFPKRTVCDNVGRCPYLSLFFVGLHCMTLCTVFCLHAEFLWRS